MQTPANILKHELIGLQIKVVDSKNKDLKSISGKIIDETKSMLTIQTKNGEKRVQKKGSHFELTLSKNKIIIDGSLIEGAPEKRIKKTIPKKRA